MPYRFALEDRDYTDFASGRVLFSQPGRPVFPVRLANEIFLRGMSRREPQGAGGPVTLYDPCCGSAYHLSVLGFLHGKVIRKLIGSDVDESVLTVARRNLGLLSEAGLDRRVAELNFLFDQYGKESHAGALESAARLKVLLREQAREELPGRVFTADALDPDSVARGLAGEPVDLVVSDLPYGRLSNWQGAGSAGGEPFDPVARLLGSLLPVLSPGAVVALACDKGRRIGHAGYRVIEKFRIGLRQVVLLRPVDSQEDRR